MTISLQSANSSRSANSPLADDAHRAAASWERAGHRSARDPRTPPPRASRILRDLLAQNPDIEHFSIERIVASIQHGGPAASLMVFSLPAIVRVPGTADLVGPPTLAMSSVFVSGRQAIRLPARLLERSVPRRALALAIHAVLPVLERAERVTKKRWSWLCTPAAHRVIGVLVFLLALPLAFPILGFGLPHAASLFTIALGMIENDGVAIALGVTAGIASLVFFTARGLTPKALAQKAADWMTRFVRQLTSVRELALTILRRAWQWFAVKLLSGPSASARRDGYPNTSAAQSATAAAPRRLMSAPVTGLPLNARLEPMVAM